MISKIIKVAFLAVCLTQILLPQFRSEAIADTQVFTNDNQSVMSVAFSPDGKLLASAGWNRDGGGGTIYLRSMATHRVVRKLIGHEFFVSSLAFSPDGKTLASGSGDKTVRIWNVRTGETMQIMKGHKSYVDYVCFSGDGFMLASSSDDGDDPTVRLWDPSTGGLIREFRSKQDNGRIQKMSFSKDGQFLVTPHLALTKLEPFGPTIDLLSCSRGNVARKFTGGLVVYQVALSPNDNLIAGASQSQILFWGLNGNLEDESLVGHSGTITSFSFNKSGDKIVTGSEDKSVKVWDVLQRKQLQSLVGHEKEVRCVAISPDGKHLASGDEASVVRLWDVDLNPSAPPSVFALNQSNDAIRALQRGDFPAAISTLSMIVSSEPNFEQARKNLAVAHNAYALSLSKTDLPAALKEAHLAWFYDNSNTVIGENLNGIIKLLKKDPQNFAHRVSLSHAALSSGDRIGAEIELIEALKIQDDPGVEKDLESLEDSPQK